MESQNTDNIPYLSKSHYIKGLQCHKALWLHKYQPELKDEVSDSQQASFDSGTDVGVLAQHLFPGGVEVPYDGLTYAEQTSRTQELIAGGTTTIYEATFSFDSIFIKVDILHLGTNGWELYEVKASTSLKDVYLNDIAVQFFVLAGCGINPSKAALVHINNQYVRQGNIEVEKLFTIRDVTGDVSSMQTEVIANIDAMRTMLHGEIPTIDIGPYCSDPYGCSFSGHCWSHIPENSVFDFRGHGRPNDFELYRQGIVRMEDAPLDMLGWRQQLQQDGLLHRKNHVDISAMQTFLDSLSYPLCFMDFETTYMTPVPIFDGTRPYQQVPFQFSLHVIPESGAEAQHYEFLSDGAVDPRQEFLNRLLEYIPPNACILTWNQSFEEKRLNELAEALPERSAEVQAVIASLRDLMVPFRDKAIYYWQFNGSYSIKAVLPALVPELSYDMLEVNNGEMAASTWLRMQQENDEGQIAELRQQLLEYCHLDTLAMVRILEEMSKMVG